MPIPSSSKKQKPSNLVQTIERVSLILDVLGRFPHGISLRKVAKQADLPKGTTHRLLSSLSYFDFVRQNESTKNYHLGFKLIELGNLLINQLDFRNEARPLMLDLAEKTGETAEEEIPEVIVPAPKNQKEAVGIYVFLVWVWLSIFVLIYVLRLKVKESDRIHQLKFFSKDKE